jgi:ribosome-associated protein
MTGAVKTTRSKPTTQDLARRAAHLALEKQATEVVIIDLRELTSMCDYFVIVSGGSGPQIDAIVEHVRTGLAGEGERPWKVEGTERKQWVLIDYVDFVVHVFQGETRELYLLERLWGDAPREVLDAGAEGS